MEFSHDALVAISKSWGLFYLIAFSIAVVVYAFRPRNRQQFNQAKHSILEQDDRPWQK
jgi:cytochrome c oxidase cbb3-type subunit 4